MILSCLLISLLVIPAWTRSLDHARFKRANAGLGPQKPCPKSCTCNYDLINCNDLIDSCAECAHWRQIDFNQIAQVGPRAFERFRFAPNQTTNIIIYKLLNGTIGADTFHGFHVPENAQVEVTFQYNSMIRFDRNALRGLRLDKNSTIFFNFPYTTQVLFVSRCFDGVRMLSGSSRLIIRILKSFSVRFGADFAYYYKTHYMNQYPADNNASMLASTPWTIERGTFIIDIKSTHLVKFEEYSFASLELKSNARFYLDLELVEKLMFQRHSFSNVVVREASRGVVFAKQITFIDYRAFSFANLGLTDASQFEVYLEELTSSLCLQRNVFSNMRLVRGSSFNFSVINSKNVQLMHHSFSNASMDPSTSRLHIGVYNMPSYLLLFHNNNYYRRFLDERLEYLWQSSSMNTYSGHHYHHYHPQPFPSSTDLFYHRFVADATTSLDKIPLERFYQLNKQTYSYNFSIERDFLSDLNMPASNRNLWIVADNLHTVLVDDHIVNYNQTSARTLTANLNFVLNLKNFVLSPSSLGFLLNVVIEFVREPTVFKLGIPMSQLDATRTVKLLGLNLGNNQGTTPNKSSDYFDYSDTSLSEFSNYNSVYSTYSRPVQIDGVCELISNTNTRINVVLRHPNTQCSCQIVHLFANQLVNTADDPSNLLPCRLPASDRSFVSNCIRNLRSKCSTSDPNGFLKGYVKFWEYCITEIDPQIKVSGTGTRLDSDSSTNGVFQNSFDGLFPSSSLSIGSSPFYDSVQTPFGDDEQDFFFKSESVPSSNASQGWSESSDKSNSVFKIVCIVILCMVVGIAFFMITVNIIQYKFRDDLLDEYDFNTTNNKINNSNCAEEESVCSSSKPPPGNSNHSLRSGNLSAVRGSYRPTNIMPSLPEYSSQADADSSESNSTEYINKPCPEVDNQIDENEYDEDDEDDENADDYERLPIDHDEQEDYVERDELDGEDEYEVSRPLKKDSGDSSGIASNSNSDQTIGSSPVITKKLEKAKKRTTFRDSSLVY